MRSIIQIAFGNHMHLALEPFSLRMDRFPDILKKMLGAEVEDAVNRIQA